MESESTVEKLERKIRTVGNQTRWWGTIVFLAGVLLAIIEASGGVVAIALGVVLALEGAIIQYAFRR